MNKHFQCVRPISALFESLLERQRRAREEEEQRYYAKLNHKLEQRRQALAQRKRGKGEFSDFKRFAYVFKKVKWFSMRAKQAGKG